MASTAGGGGVEGAVQQDQPWTDRNKLEYGYS
jgi:hypothetical protein